MVTLMRFSDVGERRHHEIATELGDEL